MVARYVASVTLLARGRALGGPDSSIVTLFRIGRKGRPPPEGLGQSSTPDNVQRYMSLFRLTESKIKV